MLLFLSDHLLELHHKQLILSHWKCPQFCSTCPRRAPCFSRRIFSISEQSQRGEELLTEFLPAAESFPASLGIKPSTSFCLPLLLSRHYDRLSNPWKGDLQVQTLQWNSSCQWFDSRLEMPLPAASPAKHSLVPLLSANMLDQHLWDQHQVLQPQKSLNPGLNQLRHAAHLNRICLAEQRCFLKHSLQQLL